MFPTRVSFITLALFACGIQENALKAMAATKTNNAAIDTRPGIGEPFSKISKACRDVREEFMYKIKSKGFCDALRMIEPIKNLPQQIDEEVVKIQGTENLQALTDCSNALKQDLIDTLNETVTNLETFQKDSTIAPEDQGAIESLKSQLITIITTQNDALFSKLINSYTILKNKFDQLASFNALSGLSRDCDKLRTKLNNSHPSKAEDKTTYIDLVMELKKAIDAKYNHQPYTPAPQKLVTSTPGSNKTTWLVAGALVFTAVMTYGEVRHKMLTKMFTQMSKFLTPFATHMGLVKAEKIIVPQLSWWGWFKHLLRLA